MVTELRAVLTMALLRLLAGTLGSRPAFMVKFGRVDTALKINACWG